MPPRSQPKIHQIQLRTHKLAIMITVPPLTAIAEIKEEALSALLSDVNQVEDVPKIQSGDDFEVCKVMKDRGKPNGEYEVLDLSTCVRDCGLAGYDTLYLQFRDPSSGDLLPVTFTRPSIDDDEDQPPETDHPISSDSRGKKRKAHFED